MFALRVETRRGNLIQQKKRVWTERGLRIQEKAEIFREVIIWGWDTCYAVGAGKRD